MNYNVFSVISWTLVVQFFTERLSFRTVAGEAIRSDTVYFDQQGGAGLVNIDTNEPLPRDQWPTPHHRMMSDLLVGYDWQIGQSPGLGFFWQNAAGQTFLFLPLNTTRYMVVVISQEPIDTYRFRDSFPELGGYSWETVPDDLCGRCARLGINPFTVDPTDWRLDTTGDSYYLVAGSAGEWVLHSNLAGLVIDEHGTVTEESLQSMIQFTPPLLDRVKVIDQVRRIDNLTAAEFQRLVASK